MGLSGNLIAPLFLSRCVEADIFITDIDSLTIGMVLDTWTCKADEGVTHKKVTGQNKFDKFQNVTKTRIKCN